MENLTFIVYLITRLDSLGPAMGALGFGWAIIAIVLIGLRVFVMGKDDPDVERVFALMKDKATPDDELKKTFGKSRAELASLGINSRVKMLEAMASSEISRPQVLNYHYFSSTLLSYTPWLRRKGYSVFAAILATVFLTLSLLTPTTKDGARILGVYGAVELVRDSRVQAFSSEISEFVQLYFAEKMGDLSEALKDKVEQVKGVLKSEPAEPAKTKPAEPAKESPKAKNDSKAKAATKDVVSDTVGKTKEVVAQVKEVQKAAKEIADAISQ